MASRKLLPPPLHRLPVPVGFDVMGLGGGKAECLGFTRAALPDQYPDRSVQWSINASGTWVFAGTVTAIGTDKGTIARTWGATRGAIFRFDNATTLTFLPKNSTGANVAGMTHTVPSLGGGERLWVTWGPDGSGGTDVVIGHGDPAAGGGSSSYKIGAGIGEGTNGFSDAAVFDQAGTANRAIAGTAMRFASFTAELPVATIVGDIATLLALGSLQVSPRPDHAAGETVTTIVDGGTWTPTDGPTTGTHNAMTAAVVTG